MRYFEGLSEEKGIKARYKELAKMYHPDRGGDPEIMKTINAQYDEVMRGHYQKAGKSWNEIEELMKNDLLGRAALQAIISFDGLNIELCGSWIWVTGETKSVKEVLKNGGFRWASQKLAWYWHPPESKKFYKGRDRDLSWIRDKYGSENLKGARASLT